MSDYNEIQTYTSIYGPDFNSINGMYTFVGTYIQNNNTNGLIYNSDLNQVSLSIESNYTTFSYPYNDTTFLHSTMNGYVVGNSGNSTSSPTVSYLFNITDTTYTTPIKFPLSKTTTTYGIWHVGGSIYVIVGGFSLSKELAILNIYNNGMPIPYGNAFIAEFNSMTNIVYNYTVIPFETSKIILSHIQGISGFKNNTNTFSLAYTTLGIDDGLIESFYVKIKKNGNQFNTNNLFYKKVNYNIKYTPNISIITSVAEYAEIGISTTETSSIAFQSIFLDNSSICLAGYQRIVLERELIKFDRQFIDENITYNNGIFTFNSEAIYNINFTIYLELLKLPIASLNVEYTINNNPGDFIVSVKGIENISTAHSMVIPCNFSTKFYVGDTFNVRNISKGTISLLPSFSKTSIGSIISINTN